MPPEYEVVPPPYGLIASDATVTSAPVGVVLHTNVATSVSSVATTSGLGVIVTSGRAYEFGVIVRDLFAAIIIYWHKGLYNLVVSHKQ